ncbi:nestin-like [Xyrauchen texanus]|uniref:nestin-like n=1 Tax=Xyrauchen texanus TaxID=154827 RepID=UPI0022421550|nr:nestin-like [Xyrauchen texanus]
MELLGVPQPVTCFWEEKYQMLELNQRLESYLGCVKLLEEENNLLREEIHTLKKSSDSSGQRKAQEEALSQARRMMEEAWRAKYHAELEVENLIEDMEKVGIRRRKEKAAQGDAQRRLAESKKELEEERRAQIWLREKVAHLESELLLQVQVHQENMETLQASLQQTKLVLMAPQPTQIPSILDLGQEYSHRTAEAWREATTNYHRQVGHLEESLNQAKANMAKIHQDKRENQHQVKHLAKELESTKTKREMLEKHVGRQREEHRQERQYLQAQVDALEEEKDRLGQQINRLMEDKQNLLQVKISLGLEVATYRALLDSEGPRTNRPTSNKTNSAFFLDALSKPTGTHPTSQTNAASCHFSSTVATSHRSITSSQNLLTGETPTWTLTRGTPQRTQSKISVTNETRVNIPEEIETAAEESVDHFRTENVHYDISLASTFLQTVTDSVTTDPEPKPEDSEVQKEDEPKQPPASQLVESKMDESALISVSADQPSSLSQTPETESWAGQFTDPAVVSVVGKDEDTEVSVEMARISYAPRVAWEENKIDAEDNKEDACEMDVRSQNINESNIFDYGGAESDNNGLTSSQVRINTNKLASSLLDQGPLYSVGGLGYMEEINEDLIIPDEQKNESNINEELTELMNSETEAEIDSIVEWERHEEDEGENEMKVMSLDSEIEDESEMGIDSEVEEEKKGIENVILTEREHEEIEVIERDIAVQEESLPHTGEKTVDLDHQKSLESNVPLAELNYQSIDEDCSLSEEYEREEENKVDEDDSPNIFASLRTDPGEYDSYTKENTLADTHPLICYKSDKETDINPQASHVGVSETSDSEDEKERMEGDWWGENPSKCFNTMEDLSEKTDMDVIGEIMTEEFIQTEQVLENREHMILQSGQDGSECHESLVVDVVEKENARTELKENHKEEGDYILRDDDHDYKVDEQNEKPILSEEQQIHHTEQANQVGDETTISYNQENVNMEPFSCLNHPSSLPYLPFPETSQQVEPESSIEVSSTLTLSQDPFITKESPIKEEDVQNMSINTNVDLMNSSEDESPNASQCPTLQNPTLLAMSTFSEQALTLGGQFANAVISNIDNDVPKEVFSKDLMEKSMDRNMGQLSPGHETENLGSPNRMLSVTEKIFGNFEEHLERPAESFSKKELSMIDIFKRNNPEEDELQSVEKESEIHSIFSSSLKEDLWSEDKTEMAATYNPAQTEIFAHDQIHLNQDMVFGEEWRDLGDTTTANGNTKEEILKSQSKDEKLQHKDEQTGHKEMVQSDDSVDDGDSWSSGDE